MNAFALRAIDDTLSENPTSFKEAMQSDQKEEWLQAIESEIQSLEKQNVFEIVDSIPEGRTPVSSKMLYKLKRNANGEIERHKARLAARGFTQQWGVDYTDTFSPVARYETIRYLLSFATSMNFEIEHVDVNTAFLYSDLEEEIYLSLPEDVLSDERDDCRCVYETSFASSILQNA